MSAPSIHISAVVGCWFTLAENFNKVENNLIYVKAAQLLQYLKHNNVPMYEVFLWNWNKSTLDDDGIFYSIMH